uniref:AbrB/MazE/SpoVT family DNA-binding domain-containing protein n=1 Tax=Bartonella grahamii TaxID=33045 RepID=UPI001ABA11ED
MSSLTVTVKGQITLKRYLLQHHGVKPGEKIDFDKLPGGELRIKASHPTSTMESCIRRFSGKLKKPL